MMGTDLEFQIDENNRANYLFELGKSRSLSGNFHGSIQILREVADIYIQQKKYSEYMECLSLLLRMYKELKDVEQIKSLKEELNHLVSENDIQISSRVYYTLGLCALHMGDITEAREQFDKSMGQIQYLENQAIQDNNEEDMLRVRVEKCFALDGQVALLIRENRLDQAEAEISRMLELLNSLKNLEQDLFDSKHPSIPMSPSLRNVLKETVDVREKLYLSTQLSTVAILRLQNRYSKAEALLWDCYEQMQKSDLCTNVAFFYYLGQNYLDMREYNQAEIFLNLAEKSLDYDNFRDLYEHVKKCQDKLSSIVSNNYDLIINLSNNTVVERHKGKINFKNQYILLSLLRTFLSTPGESYSKESLVEKVWKQQYDPRVHDNKVYVTIKRLRELMEPDIHHIRYIFCGKNGYYLNSKIRVLFKGDNSSNIQQPQEENIGEVML